MIDPLGIHTPPSQSSGRRLNIRLDYREESSH